MARNEWQPTVRRECPDDDDDGNNDDDVQLYAVGTDRVAVVTGDVLSVHSTTGVGRVGIVQRRGWWYYCYGDDGCPRRIHPSPTSVGVSHGQSFSIAFAIDSSFFQQQHYDKRI